MGKNISKKKIDHIIEDESMMLLLEYIYYKPKQCMIKKIEKEPTEQAEAKAITNLLEVDLKTQEQLPFWDEKKMMVSNPNSKKPYSLFRVQHYPKDISNNHIRITSKQQCCLKRRNLHESHHESKRQVIEKIISPIGRTQREGSFKRMRQGKNWLSQVEFTNSPMKQFTSQPKLNKKYSFSYQANCKKERSDPELQHQKKIQLQNSQQDFTNPSLLQMSNSLNIQYKTSKSQRKGSKTSRAYPKSIQDYMRQTFDHIIQKGNESLNLSFKQPQQQTSTIVRKILINLQQLKNTRATPTYLQTPLPLKKRPIVRKYNDGCFRFDRTAIQTPVCPEQPSHKSKQYILDLNMQAQNIYSAGSIHQNLTKKNHILPKMQ